MKYIYGPIPSRRLGRSLGVSPVPTKLCNYSCIYCQLGRTKHLENKRDEYVNVESIISEFKSLENVEYDVVTICGEGEPTLNSNLGILIQELKKLTTKPIVVITNGSLLHIEEVREDLNHADIVMPSLDCYNENSFRKINRGSKDISFDNLYQGLKLFSDSFPGKLWLEIMFIEGYNDNKEALDSFEKILQKIKCDRIYLNSPVRPPAEKYVNTASSKFIMDAADRLKATPIIDHNSYFQSENKNDYEAIINIIQRHPMNQYELNAFLESRNSKDKEKIYKLLEQNKDVRKIVYKGIISYRLEV